MSGPLTPQQTKWLNDMENLSDCDECVILDGHSPFVFYAVKNEHILLDGNFEVWQLEAIIHYMKGLHK